MDKCKNCGAELRHTEGRRKKEFCGSNCRATFWQKSNAKKKKEEKNQQEAADRVNPLIQAARGRDKNGVNNDEVAKVKKTTKNPANKITTKPIKIDPKEGSMAFHLKYGAFTYAELKNK